MGRSSDTWFKFYVEDWIDATRDLTLAQRGAYIDAIALQYRDGRPLADDMQKLAHRLHISKRKAESVFKELCDALRLVREERDGKRVIYDERAAKELEERAAQRSLAAENGSKGGRPKPDSTSARSPLDAGSTSNQARVIADSASNQTPLSSEILEKPNDFSENGKGTLSPPSETRTGAVPRREEEKKKEEEDYSPQPPPGGGAPPSEPAAEKSKANRSRKPLTPDQSREVHAGIDLWNATAGELGFAKIDFRSDQRRFRMHDRLREIGGLGPFKTALSMIPQDDFLMGRTSSKNGQGPFRLTFERLLSTGSNMGDVLALLLDKAALGNQPKAPLAPAAKPFKTPPEFWWRDNPDAASRGSEEGWEQMVDRFAKDAWHVPMLGPRPVETGCVVPAAVISRKGLSERYGVKENA